MRIHLLLLVPVLTVGCGAASPQAPSETPSDVALAQPIEESSISDEAGRHATDPARIVVLQTTQLGRFAEVVGVIDVHEAMGSDRAALQKLRERASGMGADAVIGVEFHHGEAEDEPTHLSGMAVRFVGSPSLPMH